LSLEFGSLYLNKNSAYLKLFKSRMESNPSNSAKFETIPLENTTNDVRQTNMQPDSNHQQVPLQPLPLDQTNQIETQQDDQQINSQTETAIPKQVSPLISQQHKRTFKIIVIGDSNVGKTCLTFRFCGGKFLQRSEATIGVDL
jgi:polynucleotide 5'-kinase involved in rRNA processing